jgi:DNA-directed RNA polymerase subunit N (RpoN/RPB10)
MIIPIRCFTCGKVLADKWVYYQEKCKEIEKRVDTSKLTIDDLRIDEKNKSTYFEESFKGELLDNIGLKKICCRRHMLGHVDLIDII